VYACGESVLLKEGEVYLSASTCYTCRDPCYEVGGEGKAGPPADTGLHNTCSTLYNVV
jgi:hypothetical protein